MAGAGAVVGRRLRSKTDQGPLVGGGGGAVVHSLKHHMAGLEGPGWYQMVSVLSPEGCGGLKPSSEVLPTGAKPFGRGWPPVRGGLDGAESCVVRHSPLWLEPGQSAHGCRGVLCGVLWLCA